MGVVDREKIVDKNTMRDGDVVIALPSSGVHSNGFSLVRKVFARELETLAAGREGEAADPNVVALAEKLLTPTKIYVRPILALLDKVEVRAIAHITGGGFYENIPRSIPDGLCARIDRSAVRVLPIFEEIAAAGNISERDMFNTFNMGVGMTVVVPKEQAKEAIALLKEEDEDGYVIGFITNNEEKVNIT